MAVIYTKDILEQSNKVVRRQTTPFNHNYYRVAWHFAATMFCTKPIIEDSDYIAKTLTRDYDGADLRQPVQLTNF